MMYDDLCAALDRDFGKCPLFFTERPDLTDETALSAEYVIDFIGGEYRIGGVERGRFLTSEICSSEDDACRYVYRGMARSASARRLTKAEEERGRQVNAEMMEQFYEQFPSASSPPGSS